MPRGLNFGFRNKRDWAIYVAKTRALISCAITAHLICTFVFTYAKKEVHSWHSSWTQLDSNRSTYVRHISHRLQRLLVGRSIILYIQRTIKVLIKLSGMICTFIVGISQKRESVILILIIFGTYDMYIMVYKSSNYIKAMTRNSFLIQSDPKSCPNQNKKHLNTSTILP